MWLDLFVWVVAILVVMFLTRERHQQPRGVDHPAVRRSQVAYRRGSLLGR